MTIEWLWLGIGFLGQALFSARFLVQWLASERARRSIVPRAFWFFSLAGGATLLAYAIYRRDPVFIAGMLDTALSERASVVSRLPCRCMRRVSMWSWLKRTSVSAGS